MRRITITLEAELQFASVAAACPPALPVPQHAYAWAPVQLEQSGEQAGTGTGTNGTASGIGSAVVLTGALGGGTALWATELGATTLCAAKAQPAAYAGAGNIAKPLGLADGSRTDLYRPFHTMSRRDPRSWRPPHSD